MKRRWDIDERGRGVGDGRRLVSGARELVEALELPEWVAEQPEAHLLPHLEPACAVEGSPLELESAAALPDAAYELRLRWRGRTGDVDEPVAGDELVFEVGTGDTHFATHGHALVLRLAGVFG